MKKIGGMKERCGKNIKGEPGKLSDAELQYFLDKAQRQQQQHMLMIWNCLAFIPSSYLLHGLHWPPRGSAEAEDPGGKEDKRQRASHPTYQRRTAKAALRDWAWGWERGREIERERRARTLKGKWCGKLMQGNMGCRMWVKGESHSWTLGYFVKLGQTGSAIAHTSSSEVKPGHLSHGDAFRGMRRSHTQQYATKAACATCHRNVIRKEWWQESPRQDNRDAVKRTDVDL